MLAGRYDFRYRKAAREAPLKLCRTLSRLCWVLEESVNHASQVKPSCRRLQSINIGSPLTDEIRDGVLFWLLVLLLVCRRQGRKEAFEQRKRELKALGLGQDGRPMKKEDDKKEVKSRGKVSQGAGRRVK